MVVAVDYKLSLRGMSDHKAPEYVRALSACHDRSAQRVLDLCRTQAGVYIKAGQHVTSLRPIVPREFTEMLASLCDDAPQSSLAEVERVFADELGFSPLEASRGGFASFDPEPLGCASLAQVHKATLNDGSGRVVAVKANELTG
ncbi:hypothetical protein T484DRAFT_1803693 [Baffinella frigidus]|nr:hypothetical protein T484DRAFT_1803693 [Cryptophyta sp. CCMP2293]